MSLEELGERELTHDVRFTLAMSMIDEGFSNTEILDVFRPYKDFNERATENQLWFMRRMYTQRINEQRPIIRFLLWLARKAGWYQITAINSKILERLKQERNKLIGEVSLFSDIVRRNEVQIKELDELIRGLEFDSLHSASNLEDLK